MKRLICLLLVLSLLLCGCGGSGEAATKENHVTTEEISREMMETLANFMPDIAESARYEFKELNAVCDDVPIHFLFIVKERFSGINEGNLWMDTWNLFVMDLDDGNVYHIKNKNYWETMSPEKATASTQALWEYEMFCTGQRDFLFDENEVWTDIVTEEDFAALQQRSKAKLPEARNILTVEKAEMVVGSSGQADIEILYVQVRNHAAPMEEYQQEWYAVELGSGSIYDCYEKELSHYDAIHVNAVQYLTNARQAFGWRIEQGYVTLPDYETWDTMFDEHIDQLNAQLLTGPVPQPIKPVAQIVNSYEIEGFSEHQNQLASLLNWFNMEGVSALSGMEYRGTIPEIDGGEYHLLFLSTDAPKGHHREDDLVIDLNSGIYYSSYDVDEGYPPLRYCEGIGMLLEGYSAFRDGQQNYIWSSDEDRTELLTDEECARLNEAAQYTEPAEITEEEFFEEEIIEEEFVEEEIFEEEIFEEEIFEEEIFEEEVFEEEIVEEFIPQETLPPLTLEEEHIEKIIDAVNTYRQQDRWANATVTDAMLYKMTMDDLGHSYHLLLIGTDNFGDYPLEGILAYDLNTGKIWDNDTALWPQSENFSGYEEALSVLVGGYAEYLLGNNSWLWTEMEQSLAMTSDQIAAINEKLQ